MPNTLRLSLMTCLMLFINACATTGNTPQAKRQSILSMKDETLTKLFQNKPHTRTQISQAPGYGVFSNANVKVFVGSVGAGHGMVKDNHTGKVTYMKMAEVGVGLGLGATDYRLVMVFDTPESMQRFVEQGWVFGAEADAAAKASDKGVAVGGEAVINGITIYQLTESGLSLKATVKGTKFWKDKELN